MLSTIDNFALITSEFFYFSFFSTNNFFVTKKVINLSTFYPQNYPQKINGFSTIKIVNIWLLFALYFAII
jgi:hypothetical protein